MPQPNFTIPYYLILFTSTMHDRSFESAADMSAYFYANVTSPYGFDRDLSAIIPALWYCLHLPRTRLDFADHPSATGIKATQLFIDLPHNIVILPVPWLGPWPILPGNMPVIIFAQQALWREAERLASLIPACVEVADTATLDTGSLRPISI